MHTQISSYYTQLDDRMDIIQNGFYSHTTGTTLQTLYGERFARCAAPYYEYPYKGSGIFGFKEMSLAAFLGLNSLEEDVLARDFVLDSCYINTQGEGISLIRIEYTSYGGAVYIEPQKLEYHFSGYGTSVARTYGG